MSLSYESFKYAFIVLTLALSVVSCSDESETKVYRLSKEATPSKDVSCEKTKTGCLGIPDEVGDSQGLVWTTPQEWEEHPAKGLRAGSFTARSTNDLNADISVIFLGGPAGGDLPNVNRWREQLELSPWTAEEWEGNHESIVTPIGEAKVVDIFSDEKLVDGEHYMRIVAAMVPAENGIWFIKMVGEKELLEVQKPVFKKFIETITHS